MKTVISASRRTDIPAFYLDWFIRAVRNKRIEVQNPLYPAGSGIVSLDPQDVGWIVFWSRNYQRLLKNHAVFSEYELFFHFTILSHSQFETVSIGLDDALSQIAKLAALYGPERIIWRYDPVIVWVQDRNVRTNYDRAEFEYLCQFMSRHNIRSCYFSFVTPYRKVLRRIGSKFPGVRLLHPVDNAAKVILDEMKYIAGAADICLFSCSNDLLVGAGVARGSCISGELLNRLSGRKVVSTARYPGRKDCGCTRSIDVGSYSGHPCYYGCLYCYANPVISR